MLPVNRKKPQKEISCCGKACRSKVVGASEHMIRQWTLDTGYECSETSKTYEAERIASGCLFLGENEARCCKRDRS
jgi:hypothetical protein